MKIQSKTSKLQVILASFFTTSLTKGPEGRGVNVDVYPAVVVDNLQPHHVRPLGEVGGVLHQVRQQEVFFSDILHNDLLSCHLDTLRMVQPQIYLIVWNVYL